VDLNPFQERAVKTPGHCTILACPGSGKTRVLSARAAHILSSHEIGRLCAVTFTRDAAEELLGRILASCGMENARRIAVGTFHSIALNQIRRNSKGKVPRLIGEGERIALIKRCWKEHAPNATLEEVQKEIDRAKGSVSYHAFSDPAIQHVFTAYEEILQADNSMDFSDILLRATRGMIDESIKPLPIKWLLVDEAQDMDAVQMEWILAHGRSGVEITLVGDDDQSLYSFRQALGYHGIREVSMALSAVDLTLPINYRCAPNILAHAAKLIGKNSNRAHKNIKAHKTEDGVVLVHRAADRVAEMEHMIEIISADKTIGEWAVLARTNQLLDEAEVALKGANIETKRSGGKSIWDHGVGAVFVGLLRSISSNTWMGLANTLAFCGAPSSLVHKHSRTDAESPLHRLDQALGEAPNEQSRRLILALREGFLSWNGQTQKNRVPLVVFGVCEFLGRYCNENQRKLLGIIKTIFIYKMSGTISQRLAIITREKKQDQAEENGVVHLMTLHASKGLEFDNVWIIGCEEGNLPHTDSTEEDERRLMYVGMTRARSRLVMSSALSEGMESRFFDEAGLSPV